MILIYGKRVAKIKEFTDNSNCCTSCKAFDLQVRVFREYYHVFYIPFAPFGDKLADIRCNECTEPIRTEVLKKVYEKYTKTPVYMYSVLLLLVVLIGLLVFAGIQGSIDRARWIAKPRAGDVYLVNKDVDENKTIDYYFLRVVETNGDTVFAYHNNLVYLQYVTQLNPDDYFVKDEKWYFTKAEIQKMYDEDEITSVEREYGISKGFDRIK
jgi:hypothetical protein